MVVGLIVEEIWNVVLKCVNVTGARNIGQGHRVKVPAESVHCGEALCKVWWLWAVEAISSVNVKSVKVTGEQSIGQGHLVKVPAESVHLGEALCKVWWLLALYLRKSGTST